MLRAEITERCVLQPAALSFTAHAKQNLAELHIHQTGCWNPLLHSHLQACLAPGQSLARVNQPIKTAVTSASEELS